MPFKPISVNWPSNQALLFVHGVGNAKPGDYDVLVQKLREALGEENFAKLAIYPLFYDPINDWFAEKMQLSNLLTKFQALIKVRLGGDSFGAAIGEYAGDVLWPALSQSARAAVKEAYLAQLKQIVIDGIAAGHRPLRQKISILCHGLGCFHTYEALHAAAADPAHRLMPATDGVRFTNVIFTASPIQMIKTIAEQLGALIPKAGLAILEKGGIVAPSELTAGGQKVFSIKNWIAITGDLDPLGGYFFRQRADWAWMNAPNQISIVDSQQALNIRTKEELAQALSSSSGQQGVSKVELNNPHAWIGYVDRHQQELKQWLTA
jgi:hypothetical protein